MAPATEDPYYNRKQVPNDFIEHVGFSGMSPEEEHINRERKFSINGSDVRRFSNPKSKDGTRDPYYQRKPIPSSVIKNVGETGLTPEEEYLNREKKYTANGADVRKFSHSTKGFLDPIDDPYYGRKQINSAETHGVGETGQSRAEEYEVRERKQSLFQDSGDPFQLLTGTGHRQSVSGGVGPAAAAARRRSSTVAPDAQVATAAHGHHSGYTGEQLAPIISRPEFGTASLSDDTTASGSPSAITSSGVASANREHITGSTGHTTFYDAATAEHVRDLDSVGPHDMR